MKIHYWGHVNDLTNSMKFINTISGKILIDCGTSHDPSVTNLKSDFLQRDSLKDIIAIIITDAQIDHTEYLLQILTNGFSGPIFCTSYIYEKIRNILTAFTETQEKPMDAEKLKEIFKHIQTFELGERFEIDETENCFIYNGNTPKVPSVLIQTKKNKMVITNDLENISDQKLIPPKDIHGSCDFYRLDCDDILPSIWQKRDL